MRRLLWFCLATALGGAQEVLPREVYFNVYPKDAKVYILQDEYPSNTFRQVVPPSQGVPLEIRAPGWETFRDTVSATDLRGQWPKGQPLRLKPASLSAHLSQIPVWTALTLPLIGIALWLRKPNSPAPTSVTPAPPETAVISGMARIGAYQVHEKLGEGASGIVYRVTGESGEAYALKLLKSQALQEADTVSRFRREMKILRELRHPNLPYLVDYGEHAGSLYLVMELLGQKHLGQQIPLPLKEAVRVMLQLVSALEVCHRAGVLHRDLKPANVIWGEDGRVRLTDFGLARHSNSSTLTQEGTVMGTPHYMAPEIIQGHPACAASDQYSLGCMFYEMLSGQAPFVADNPMAVLMQHLQDKPRSLAEVPSGVNQVVERLLAKNPQERYLNLAIIRSKLEPYAK